MTPVIRNIIWYVAIAFAGAVLATGLQLGVVLAGTDDIQVRPLLATFVQTLFAALATAAGTSFRPKAGREDISALVSDVGPSAARDALEVEAVRQATGSSGLSPEQTADIVAAVKAEMTRDPHGRLAVPRMILSANPDPLPPTPRYPRHG